MAALSEPEVVTRSRRCREITADLLRQSVIAMDAEGVQLGKDGPMTLLQIGTIDGRVYLFDVQENKNLLKEGRLADVLESMDVVKVIHSCSGDNAALHFQFETSLRNVFDTQIAHLVIEEEKGRRLAKRLKLDVICQTYSTSSTVSENKDELKEVWTKDIGDLWATRPLTEDMIQYAAGDVTALIPEVYETQKKFIEDHGILGKFNERVEEEILYHIDDKMKEKRRQREQGIIEEIIRDIDEKYDSQTSFKDITDEDDQMALKRLDFRDMEGLSPFINRLKTECIKVFLEELDDQIDEEGERLLLKGKPEKFLYILLKHPDKTIREDAKRIRQRINEIVLRDISRKYDTHTTLNMVSIGDKEVIRSMFPQGCNDPNYDATQHHLYWSLMAEDVDYHVKKLHEKGRDFTLSDGYHKRLKFYCSGGKVPQYLKSKAKNLLRELDNVFGRNKVPRPAK